MPVTLHGFKGAHIDPQSGLSGLDRLREKQTKDEAKQILLSLSDNLRHKSGVVRLLHTSSADKDMKFQTAGGFKQTFLSGEKLQRSKSSQSYEHIS